MSVYKRWSNDYFLNNAHYFTFLLVSHTKMCSGIPISLIILSWREVFGYHKWDPSIKVEQLCLSLGSLDKI